MNEHADVTWRAGQWIGQCDHGSGSGRSFGSAFAEQATEDGWANNSQTRHFAVFDTQAGANTWVAANNEYYDGSESTV